jgi:hypothetical protein
MRWQGPHLLSVPEPYPIYVYWMANICSLIPSTNGRYSAAETMTSVTADDIIECRASRTQYMYMTWRSIERDIQPCSQTIIMQKFRIKIPSTPGGMKKKPNLTLHYHLPLDSIKVSPSATSQTQHSSLSQHPPFASSQPSQPLSPPPRHHSQVIRQSHGTSPASNRCKRFSQKSPAAPSPQAQDRPRTSEHRLALQASRRDLLLERREPCGKC